MRLDTPVLSHLPLCNLREDGRRGRPNGPQGSDGGEGIRRWPGAGDRALTSANEESLQNQKKRQVDRKGQQTVPPKQLDIKSEVVREKRRAEEVGVHDIRVLMV